MGGHVEPTALRFASDGRLFVAEKQGRIWAYDSGVNPGAPSLVVDLRTSTYNFWDRGLLGLAVDPAFPTRPFVYVLYTLDANPDGTVPRWGIAGVASDNCPSPPGATGAGCVVDGRLSRITVDLATMQGVEQPLMSGNWCQQFPSHSTGDLTFGSDGMLYVTAGDGASFNQADWGQLGGNPCGDPSNEGGSLRSQDMLTPGDPLTYSGTVLRMDVSETAPRAPSDNPLADNASESDDYVIGIGLRNPFRISTRPGTNELWIGDVGWTTIEEVNLLDSLSTVSNFGWPCYEGNGQQGSYQATALCQQLYGGAPIGMQVRAPFYEYGHNQFVTETDGCGKGGSAITGLAFNADDAYPTWYAGALFFADSTRRCLWAMPAGPSGRPNSDARELVARTSARVVDLQFGPEGFAYYADFDGGNVYRLSYYAGNSPPNARLTASTCSGSREVDHR